MSQYQRSEYRQQFLPEVDHRLAVWQAYLNCVNSFQGLELTTLAEEGKMVSVSQVPEQRFKYSLGVLDALLEQDKDDDFKKTAPANVADLIDSEPKFTDYFRYWTRLDRLMREQGFYTTSKLPGGHL
jgi:hypothetical protein